MVGQQLPERATHPTQQTQRPHHQPEGCRCQQGHRCRLQNQRERGALHRVADNADPCREPRLQSVDPVELGEPLLRRDLAAFCALDEVGKREGLVEAQIVLGSHHPDRGTGRVVEAAVLNEVREHQQLIGQPVMIGRHGDRAAHQPNRTVRGAHRRAQPREKVDGCYIATVCSSRKRLIATVLVGRHRE